MKKFNLLLAFILNIVCLNAQNVNLDWAKSIGGATDDAANSVAVDKNGNVYSAGYFEGKVDFDPGKDTFFLSSAGKKDIFISKLDDKGQFVWALRLGDTDDDAANAIALDTAGNVFVSGYFQGSSDFDPGTGVKNLTATAGSDIFVCKFNASGSSIWAKSIGGKGDEIVNSIYISLAGNSVITGSFSDSIVYNISSSKNFLITNGAMDILIGKLDANGDLIWLQKMGGSTDDVGNSVWMDKSENTYLTGYFTGKAVLSTGSSSAVFTSFGGADAFVTKLDGKGNYSWTQQLGGNRTDIGNGIIVDGSGNVFTTGVFEGTADFNPAPKGAANLSSQGGTDIYVSKLDGSGTYGWAVAVGGKSDDAGMAIAIDGSSNVYTAGSFQDRVDFDPGTSSNMQTAAGGEDIFVLKLNSSANFVWIKTMGGGKNDKAKSLAVTSNKSVYSAGYFAYRSDFDPEKDTVILTSNGDNDAFIQKMKVCSATSSTITKSSCYDYTFNGVTYDVSGTYTQILTNVKGCDSVINLKLTIYTTTFNYLTVVACKSYTINGQTYTSPGVYNQVLVNKNGCDSVLVLDLSFGETSRTISAIACDNYTINGKVYNKTGVYTQVLKNKTGCDSTLTLKLTIKKSTSSTLNIKACDSYTLISKTYTSSGVYTQTTRNNADCDSVITLNLTIVKSSSSNLDKVVCDVFNLNGTTYNKTGVYNQKILNKAGCDSFITLNLSVNNTSSVISRTACRSLVLNSKFYDSSGTYNQTIPNVKGCDSSITLNLVINKVNAKATQDGAVLTAEVKNATYQWLDCNNAFAPVPGQTYRDFLVKTNGTYAVKVTENSCSDTSQCLTVNFNSIRNYSKGFVEIWPNPTNGNLTLKSTRPLKNANIVIVNSLGQTMQTFNNLEGTDFKLDISDFAKGIYVIEIEESDEISRFRIMKD
jgi:hypothetical protein